MARWVLHVDLDQFIAAVEVQRHPELRGRPVVVGTTADPTQRGVVSTASYEAREFGVRSGLPLRVALRRCPQAVFLPADKPAYEAVSRRVMATLRATGRPVEVLGWDEAFVDVVTDDPEGFARELQARVKAVTDLNCSVGIGENPLQAKIATEFAKPAGTYRLTSGNWFDVLGQRAPDVLWGVGRATTRKLKALGITTVDDLADADPARLADVFGPTMGPWLIRLGRGEDRSVVARQPLPARSRSREITFPQDVTDVETLLAALRRLARQVAEDVAAEGRPAVRVVVKVRYAPFATRTHGQPTPGPTDDPDELEQVARRAWDAFAEPRPVRLLGVRADLAPPPTTPVTH